VDLLFAEIILEIRRENRIWLEAAIPYRNRIKDGSTSFGRLFEQCDAFTVINETYFPGCYQEQDLWMVEHSDMVIAVYDGKGGAFIRGYARVMDREVREIHI